MMFYRITILHGTLCIVHLLVKYTWCHELCVNGTVPVDRSRENFKICKQYSSNSCCTADANVKIYDMYKQYIKDRDIDSGCASYIENIFCQECSPKSAHLFAGNSVELRHYPILCSDYCREFLDSCAHQARDLIDDGLCDSYSASQQEYCYPKSDSQDASHRDEGGKTEGQHEDDNCVPICLQKIIGSVRNIVGAAFPQDGSDRLFLVQQDGIVWELTKSREMVRKPFIDIVSKVHQNPNSDERGLLSMAFHPNYASNGLLYLFYNPNDPSSWRTLVRVSEMRAINRGSTREVDTKNERILLEFEKPESNHNGGQLFFGKDEYLYITVGDGGGGGDRHGPEGNGQNLKTYHGKILRIDVDPDVDADTPYRIPNDNPFVGEPAKAYPEIYAYGLRNPWRTSVDRETGEIYCGDVGQGQIEEVDIILKGKNYGWRAYEGERCYDQRLCNKLPKKDTELPIFTYDHAVGNSVIGGFVYRGSAMPHLAGKYIFGDYREGKLFQLERSGSKWHKKNLCIGRPYQNCPAGSESMETRVKLFGFGEDEGGELYIFVADTSKIKSPDGAVYKLTTPTNVL